MTISVYSSKSIRDAELRWAENRDGSTYPLMERAGRAAWQTIRKFWPEVECLTILCGKGNNGGDGFELGRLAIENGLKVNLFAVAGECREGSDACKARERYLKAGGKESEPEQLNLDESELIVDALLGTGVSGAVKSPLREVIELINQANAPIFSLDIPSGLNSDSGLADGLCVHASRTLSFIGFKVGLTTGDAAKYTGHLDNNQLAMDWIGDPLAHLIDAERVTVPARSASDHKGAQGAVTIIAGSQTMGGAALMAAEAATRMGVGLIRLMSHENNIQPCLIRIPEVMPSAWQQPDQNNESIYQTSALVLGPGLSQSPWAKEVCENTLKAVFKHQSKIVMDADALNFLALNPQQYEHWILTPHPGEAARLLGCSIADIALDRVQAAQSIQQKYGGVCVLKGAGTVVSSERKTWINTTGNGGMAKPGMGDVLAGITGALLARLDDCLEAAKLGVWMHGQAGDRSAELFGREAMRSTDLINQLPATWSDLNVF